MRILHDLLAHPDGGIRLSRLLAALHVGGVLLLLAVVLGSVVWVSSEHNRLAQTSSERLVRGGIGAFRSKLDTLVRDYSIWDSAFEATRTNDRRWLYDNIGNAVTVIGTLDLIVFVPPDGRAAFGWRSGSPPEGESDLLPQDLKESLLTLLERPTASHAVFARLEGEIWAFAIAEVTRVGAAPLPRSLLPRQIHGLRLSQERLDQLAETLLIEGGLSLQPAPSPAQASLALTDGSGEVIAYVTWAPPRPGARILQRIALPLTLALAVAAAIGLISARFSMGSARRLEWALDAARAADRTKSEFLSNVTHELRTPMNGIIGVAQLLEMSELDEDQRELVGVLDASARTQMSLISDLLDFTRLESGYMTLATAPFKPGDALEEIASLIRAGLVQKGIAFDADVAALTGVTVLGDARAFRQIVTNLLGNAAKFTPEGRVALRATVHRAGDGAEMCIEVEDTGVGIPEADLARIFDRFHRVDASLTRATDGTGLGLSISRQLAGLMGGRIEVESRLGEGSTFRFRVGLPLATVAALDRDAA